MSAWAAICDVEDILPESGVCALVNGRQIAVFRCGDRLYALDNFDPASGASVLSRGIVGYVKGESVVASPLHKHHYSLRTGRCLEEAGESVSVYPVRAMDGRVWVSEVYSAGDLTESEGCEALSMSDHRRGIHKRLLIRDNCLQGAVLHGDASLGSWYLDLIATRADISGLREQLLFGPDGASDAGVGAGAAQTE